MAAARVIVLLTVLVLGIGTQTASTAPPALVSYQVHSYDDLREWPQALAKGTQWFKLDPHWMDGSFCSSAAAADASDGCFLLSHDRPVASRHTYNTTDDLLALLATPALRPYVADPGRRIFIALCFKWDLPLPLCVDLPPATHWRAAADAFFAAAASTIATHGLNVELVLDGAATPTGRPCLAQRWLPWNATFIPGRDPAAAGASDSPEQGYNRYQVLNIAAGSPVEAGLVAMRDKNYQKFLGRPYPFLFWEPSDAPSIDAVVAAYLAGPRHGPGLRFAINTDPAQLAVYAAAQLGTNTSTAGPTVSRQLAANGSRPLVDGPWTVFLDPSSSRLMYTFIAADGTSAQPPAPLPVPADVAGAPHAARTFTTLASTSATSPPLVLLSDAAGRTLVFSASASTHQLALAANITLSPSAAQSSVCILAANASSVLVLQVYASSASSAASTMVAQVYALAPKTYQATPVGPAAPVALPAGVSPRGALALAVDPASGEGLAAFADTTNATVYVAALTQGPVATTARFTAFRPATVGTGAAVAVAPTQAGGVFGLVVAADSWCPNSGSNNKEATPATCDNPPTSTPSVLTYAFGPVAVLAAGTPWSPCQAAAPAAPAAQLLFGSFGTGAEPTAALLPSAAAAGFPGPAPPLALRSVHSAAPAGQDSNSDCGSALARSGIILDQWQFPIGFA